MSVVPLTDPVKLALPSGTALAQADPAAPTDKLAQVPLSSSRYQALTQRFGDVPQGFDPEEPPCAIAMVLAQVNGSTEVAIRSLGIEPSLALIVQLLPEPEVTIGLPVIPAPAS